MKYVIYKFLLHTLLRLPDFFFEILFKVAFPIYRALHKKRAYGRVVRHLENAGLNITADDVYRGIYWNAIDSYRGLARLPRTTKRIVFENEDIIRNALKGCPEKGITAGPVAAISIHQGSFELLHRSLCRYSDSVHLVTDTLKDGALRRVIQELRSDSHLTEYSPDESRALVRNLFKSTKCDSESPADIGHNAILAMVFDQGKNTKGNRIKLFGQDSTLYLRLPQLVNQMGAGIVTFRTYTRAANSSTPWFGKGRREIVIRFETYYPPKSDETKAGTNGNGLVNSIAKEAEAWIAQHPEQWSWNYHGNFR